jgi:hypothetical protein
MLYPSSPTDVIIAAMPDRGWKAITLRASRLKLKRTRENHSSRERRRWTQEEDERLELSYYEGKPLKEIAGELRRSIISLSNRASNRGLYRPPLIEQRKSRITWEVNDLVSLQAESPRGGLRGRDF